MGGGTIPAPRWINSGAELIAGLDLLGLRLPVQFIGGALFDGVTTVTPQARYLAIRAWLIHKYGQSGLPDSWQRFTEFALRIESAIVLSNLLEDRGIGNLIGAEKALERLNADTPVVSIGPLVKVPAATVYAGPSDWQQLAITKDRGEQVPALVEERGVPLAKAVDLQFEKVSILNRLLADPSIDEVLVEDLRPLGAIARVDRITAEERLALLASILPASPRAQERSRSATYAALLSLAGTLKKLPSEQDLFDAACSKRRFSNGALDAIADGWVTYCVRDLIAVTQEAVLCTIVTELNGSASNGKLGVAAKDIVASLMERVGEHDAALRALGLLKTDESISALSFKVLRGRVEDDIASGKECRHGIARWDSSLTETKLYTLALRSGAGALSLAVVAWILADFRVGVAVRENTQQAGGLSYQGWRRFGLKEVVLPELERFWNEDAPLREAAAEMAYRTVNQHLQIAWSRLQGDPRNDVALITTEGDIWYARKRFAGGRTASRISQSVGWLKQLGLINDDGLTKEGEAALADVLKTLEMGVSNESP